jgi:hypothetical protein
VLSGVDVSVRPLFHYCSLCFKGAALPFSSVCEVFRVRPLFVVIGYHLQPVIPDI